jgi:GNAT superfamily N-acetyltransferase
MPRTLGDTFVHLDEIDYLVLHEEPLVVKLPALTSSEISNRIGHYVSQLVNDEATLQIGFGQLPYAILQHLAHKKDLGVHTMMITDAFLPLFKNNAITNKKKTLLPGRTVASLVMGSDKIYDYVDSNPAFYFRSSEYVNDPVNIARNDNLISISSALEVDLTGQVCSDSLGYLFYSGIGDQVDFIRGSAMSNGGFSIIALPSTAQGGRVSRIVPHLSEGAGVATTRGDIHFVVTEYGIAELQGKSIYQRVMELAQIAHPKFREELIETAKGLHYIFADQLPPVEDDLIFLEAYKSCLELDNGMAIEFRPLLPSDEFAYRDFFYSLQDETIYSRFFHYKRLFSHERIQEQVANVDYRKNMTLAGFLSTKGYKRLMALGSYAMAEDDMAEVAFVVHEELQGMGIGSYLLERLEKIAKENSYKRFCATVLKENTGMIRVFKKKYPDAKISMTGGEVTLIMDFGDSSSAARRK